MEQEKEENYKAKFTRGGFDQGKSTAGYNTNMWIGFLESQKAADFFPPGNVTMLWISFCCRFVMEYHRRFLLHVDFAARS